MANDVIKMPENFGIYKWNGQEIALTADLIRQNVCPTLTDVEVFNFGFLCQQNDLNPFTREAFAVKYGASPASLIIAKQGLSNRAERSQHLKSKVGGIIETRQNPQTGEWETKEVEGSFVDPGWQIYGGWAIVERDDRDKPVKERILFSEYINDKNPLWKSKPATMTAKVAMQHALREAFPLAQMNGVYYEDEFSDDANPNKRNAGKTPARHSEFADIEDVEVVNEAPANAVSQAAAPEPQASDNDEQANL